MISAGSSPQTGDEAWVRVGIVSAAVVDAGTAVVAAADTEGKVGAGVAAVGGVVVAGGTAGAHPA